MKVYRAKTPARAIQKTIDVAASFGEDLDKRVYIFVESRASLSYEAAIAKKLGGSFSISVMSFSRYVSLSQKVEKYLTKTSAALVIRKLIEENFSILTRLRRGTSNLAVNVYNVISQMKSAKVSPKDLFSVIEKEGGAFAGKLKDIAFLYAEYERFIKDGGYTDENAFLQMMPDILRHDENMRGAKVIVSGISNLTKNAIDILDTLNALTDLSVVTVSHDAAGYTNEIYRKILALYKDCRIFDDGKASDEQEAVINGLFDPLVFKKAGLYSDKVHIFEYADVTGEAHAVAKRIRFEVVNNKRRYRDFVIAAGDVARYAPLYKRVFSEYGIPLFADEKKSIAAHPLVTLILTLIDCKRLNFRPDVCLKAVKNPFFTDEAQAGAFEDYLLAVTPSRRMMVKEFSVPEAEKARSKLVEVVSELSAKNTVNGYIGWLLRLYDRLCFDKENQKLSDDLSAMGEDELAMFTVTAYKALSGLIESTASVAGDALVDIDLFKSLFSSAVGATEISLIATHSDCVFFGDTKTAPLFTAKVLLCVGFDSGVPSVKKDVSLLCDKDLIRLDGYKCVIEPKLKIVNVRERESVMNTLAAFSEKLYLSYARLGFLNEACVKSEVVDYLERIFDIKTRRVDDEVRARVGERGDCETDYMSSFTALKSALKDFNSFKTSAIDKLSFAAAYTDYVKDNDKSAYNLVNRYFLNESGDNYQRLEYKGKISATLIETYFTCPYKAFGERVLRLKELTGGDASGIEIGLIFHKVLEKFALKCEKLKKDEVAAAALAAVDQVLSEPDYARYLNKKQYEYLFALVKKEIVATCQRVYDDILSGDFTVLGTEMRFDDVPGSPFRAIKIDTVNGVKRVTGVIDRVDTSGRYARVIDYKTGKVDGKTSVESLYTGTSIQLYLYLNAVKQAYEPAAAHYMAISDGYVNEGEDKKTYYGASVADDDVAARFHEDGEKNYGISRDKDGHVKPSSSVLTKGELDAFVDYAKAVTESGANEIYGGYFQPTPYKEDACKYCALSGMCGYDCEVGLKTRAFSKSTVTKSNIVDALNGGDGDE